MAAAGVARPDLQSRNSGSGPAALPAASPKRRQRAAADELSRTGVGTKAQQALQLQREQSKLQRQERCRERDAAEQERKFPLRREKRREKRRGQFFRSLSRLNDFGMDTDFVQCYN